jgi:hypothetical protein
VPLPYQHVLAIPWGLGDIEERRGIGEYVKELVFSDGRVATCPAI